MHRAARSEIAHPELPQLARHRVELRELSNVQTPIFRNEDVNSELASLRSFRDRNGHPHPHLRVHQSKHLKAICSRRHKPD
jgi:hypothetical protein